jgi:hypothetical protein
MVEPPRRVDLRLTIPAKAPYRDIAAELAGKFAEYAGASQRRAAEVSSAVQTALGQATTDSVDIEMAASGDELIVTANPGPSAEPATFPLLD